MYDSIIKFSTQFKWQPQINNPLDPKKFTKYVLAGMGGSHLAGGLVNIFWPEIDLWVHRDYGLPDIPESEKEKTLIIASSYSGNTEETLNAAQESLEAGFSLAIITTGGKLLEFAKENKLSCIELPTDDHLQPRMAVGYSLIALLKLIGEEEKIKEISELGDSLYPLNYEEAGKELADKLNDRIPLIYSSARNKPLGYMWKIKLNETGKIPAFYNAFSELNHNELESFDSLDKDDSQAKFQVIMLADNTDHPRIQERMNITRKILEKRGIAVEMLKLEGSNKYQKIFGGSLLADWTAYHIATNLGLNAEAVATIEEFKSLITD